MKLTCLSRGGGYHFPPSHMLELCGFRILLECPLDLSALTVFSPVPAHLFPPPSECQLIRAVPWYKTLKNLHLWDPSLIDAVLVSTPAGMLGLPFLTLNPRFHAKIYATEPTLRIGRLMMEDLVSMHEEFVRFYGPEEKVGFPEWMRWEEVEKLSLVLREVVMGNEGEELASWLPLYSAADAKECVQKVQSLKYAEEACFNGTIMLKAFSSGLEIGSCNWTINGPRRGITYLSSSIFESAYAMNFDYTSLQANDIIIFSDIGILNTHNNASEIKTHDEPKEKDPHPCDVSPNRVTSDNEDEIRKCLTGSNESSEEMDKISFICSCIMDSLNEGGSVLIPIGRLGVMLVLLEKISQSLESSNMKVPIFMISSTAEEMLAYTNAAPEWLCKHRQEKLFSGEALFGHGELMKEKKLNLFPVLHSPDLLRMWQEPCIVFSPHWSLRFGPAVHLLHRWHADCKSLLILEEGVDAEAALLPFRTVAIKVLQCSFLSGIKVHKVQPLLETLQPKLILFPADSRAHFSIKASNNYQSQKYSSLYYSENVTVRVPNLRDNFEAFLAPDLVFQLRPKRLKLSQKDMAIARLKGGQLLLSNGKYYVVPSEKKLSVELPSSRPLLYWGCVDHARLLAALQEKGINACFVSPRDDEKASMNCGGITYTIRISVQEEEAFIETSEKQTMITCADEAVASLILEALGNVCDGI